MGKSKDAKNQKFGRLTVIESAGSDKNKRQLWLCECECENKTRLIVSGKNLRNGNTKSCGCLKKDRSTEKCTTHGKSDTRLYGIYYAMKKRCYYEKDKKYSYYGGRGIKICDEWLNDFMNFYYWSIENGYTDELSIDRKDVNGNYEPNNCRWITMTEQHGNTSRSLYVELDGVVKSVSQLSEESGIRKDTLRRRIHRGLKGNELLKPT